MYFFFKKKLSNFHLLTLDLQRPIRLQPRWRIVMHGRRTLQAVADTFNVQIHLLTTFSTDNVITVAPLEELQTAGDDGGSASSSAVEGVPIWLGFYAEFHYVSIEQIWEGGAYDH